MLCRYDWHIAVIASNDRSDAEPEELIWRQASCIVRRYYRLDREKIKLKIIRLITHRQIQP